MYLNYIAEELLEGAGKGVEKDHCTRFSHALITVLIILFHKGESDCVEFSKEIYTIAVKKWSDKKAKRLYVSLFEYGLNKLQR